MDTIPRDRGFYSKTMKNRDIQDKGIKGTITNITVYNNFVYVGNKNYARLKSDLYNIE